MRIQLSGLSVAMLLVAPSAARAAEVAASAVRPNIVVIVADDLRWDALGCAGHPLLKTPQIDRLAAEGTRFSEAFVTTAICCVSRASISCAGDMRNTPRH